MLCGNLLRKNRSFAKRFFQVLSKSSREKKSVSQKKRVFAQKFPRPLAMPGRGSQRTTPGICPRPVIAGAHVVPARPRALRFSRSPGAGFRGFRMASCVGPPWAPFARPGHWRPCPSSSWLVPSVGPPWRLGLRRPGVGPPSRHVGGLRPPATPGVGVGGMRSFHSLIPPGPAFFVLPSGCRRLVLIP